MEELQQLFNSIGALAEMCKLFYDRLRDLGFTDQQALTLTTELPRSVFLYNQRGENE